MLQSDLPLRFRARERVISLLIVTTLITAAIRESSAQAAAPLAYPQSRRSDQTDNYHGTSVSDPFRWLEDNSSAETRQWITAQNALTSGVLAAIPVRDSIRDRITQLWDFPKHGVPIRARNRYFYLENSGLQNQAVLYVKEGVGGKPQVLIDPNKLSADGTISLSDIEPSPNSNFVAYSVSKAGSDWQEIRIRDVRRVVDLPDTLKWVKFSTIAWTRDNEGFFYARYDAPKPGQELTAELRNQKLYFHRRGTSQSEDQLILQRPDAPELGFMVETTVDGEFAVISVWRGTDPQNMVYCIDLQRKGADAVGAPVFRLIDSFKGSFRFVRGDSMSLYFHTDYQAPRGRVIRIQADRPAEQYWVTAVNESSNTIQEVAAGGDLLLVHYLNDAKSLVNLHSTRGSFMGTVPLPGPGTVTEISSSQENMDAFFTFTSYLSPPTVYAVDLRSGRVEPYKAPTVGFPFDQYETKQIFATGKDGTRIPMFLTARKGIALDGNNPTIMYGYGGFQVSLTPEFSPALLAWLERGGVFVSVNTRGGGEYGRAWHEAGTLLQKQNVFNDFIAATEHIIQLGYTRSSRLAIMGGSNGGLLVGAVMTQRPDLAAVALPAVGVMDMLRFQKFTIGWAWTSDYGSSDNAEHFRTLFAYSPLHNLKAGTQYPATLITTADHDDRVVPAHSFKFAAALQSAQSGAAPALIRIETESGHGAGKPTGKRIEEWADRYAFAWHYTNR